MITELSIEEVECRRKQKQTKKHLEMITKINEEITNYEQMITFGTLLNG
jgi:DNA-dependent RNA polymerase auxiliary subunit epsilon